jgi:hypothetical protein
MEFDRRGGDLTKVLSDNRIPLTVMDQPKPAVTAALCQPWFGFVLQADLQHSTSMSS